MNEDQQRIEAIRTLSVRRHNYGDMSSAALEDTQWLLDLVERQQREIVDYEKCIDACVADLTATPRELALRDVLRWVRETNHQLGAVNDA